MPFSEIRFDGAFLLPCCDKKSCSFRFVPGLEPTGTGLRKGQDMYFNQMEFGQRVKALRKENGLTIQQMADDLNISYEHYKKIENGGHGCSITVLLDISAYFDVSTDFLLTGRSFETLHIQKQLTEAQAILANVVNSLK